MSDAPRRTADAPSEPHGFLTWIGRVGVLVLAWPIGAVLLLRDRRIAGGRKLALSLATLPLFLGGLAGLARYHPWRTHRVGLLEHQRQVEAERAADLPASLDRLPPWTEIDPVRSWPAFRGPNRDGLVRGVGPLRWSAEGLPLRWKRRIGPGLGSFAIAQGRAFTLELQGDDEAVLCLALDDGRVVWQHRYPARFEASGAGPGPRSTPTLDGERVYTLGATGVLSALDAVTGALLWTRNVLDDAGARNITWGVSNSPLVDGGRVIVVAGGPAASLAAYDAQTGEPAWSAGTSAASYASLAIAKLGGLEQLLAFDAEGLSAYARDGSRQGWRFPWKTEWDVNAAQPIVLDDRRVLISSGYNHGCALLELTGEPPQLAPREVWSNRNLRIKYSGAVAHEGFVYGPDEQIFVCLEAATGERRWRGGRYGYCFPLLVGGQIVVACENGDVALLEATPREHRELGRYALLDDRVMNYPAIGEGVLLLRNDRQVACVELEAAPAAADAHAAPQH